MIIFVIGTTSGKTQPSTFGTNHLVQARPGRCWVLPSCSKTLAILHTLGPSCGFCQIASFGARPQADSVPLPPHCSLKKANTWQKLTELKWDHWLFSRKGVTTHPSNECLIELAELHYSTNSFFFFLHLLQWFVHPLFLASAIDQIMTCEASRMQGKGESNFKKSVWAWDEAILLG